MDDLSTTFSESANSFNLGFTNPFNPGQDLGNSDYDVRHRFTFGGIWRPTFLQFNNSSGLVHSLMGGWEVAPIFTARTGSTFTLYDCTTAVFSCVRAVAAPGLTYTGTPKAVAGQVNTYDYITIPAAAANPSTGFRPSYKTTPGGLGAEYPVCTGGVCNINAGLGKDRFFSPDNYMLDMGIYKSFKFTERVSFQLRGEFYNILNHHNQNVNAGNADLSSVATVQTVKGAKGGAGNSAGVPGSGDERRNIQIGAKIIF